MNNTISKSLAVLAVGGLMFLGSAAAQQDNTAGAGAGQVDPGHPRVNQVNQRETNQQNRIANGVRMVSSPLDRPRAWSVGSSVCKITKRDMAKDNGHLTKQDQRQLNREANRMSNRIYKDKHSAK